MAVFMLETLTSIGVNTGRMKLIILKKQSFVEKTLTLPCRLWTIWTFPDGPGASTIARLTQVNFFAKTKQTEVICAESLENDRNLKNSKISKLQLYQ